MRKIKTKHAHESATKHKNLEKKIERGEGKVQASPNFATPHGRDRDFRETDKYDKLEADLKEMGKVKV